MKRLIPGLLLLFFAPWTAVPAQESADEAAAPEETAPPEARGTDAERDELEPAVPSEVLAAGATRDVTAGGVMDRLELERTEITGNQELPKVLYIVPWRKSDPGDLMGQPVNTLLNEVLAPVDRTEFRREVDYYNRLQDEQD